MLQAVTASLAPEALIWFLPAMSVSLQRVDPGSPRPGGHTRVPIAGNRLECAWTGEAEICVPSSDREPGGP